MRRSAIVKDLGGRTELQVFTDTGRWYTGLRSSRTRQGRTYPLHSRRPDFPPEPMNRRTYRNPVIFARELQAEMVDDRLTRRQLALRHDISSDLVTQWLSVLKLSEERLRKIEAWGDYWSRQVVTERELRGFRYR